MGVSDGLLKGRGESGLCMCVCAALANSCLANVGGAPSRSFSYSFLSHHSFRVFSFCQPVSKSDPKLCLNSDINKLAGWLAVVPSPLSRTLSMYLSIISIAFSLHHPLLSSRRMANTHSVILQRFIHQPATNFLLLNSTQLNSTKKKRLSHFQAPRTDIHTVGVALSGPFL